MKEQRVASESVSATFFKRLKRWSAIVNRVGLQPRIMAYVTVGLLAMFGAFAYEGLQAIDRSTQLIFEERLIIAHSLAAMLDRSFNFVVSDAKGYLENGDPLPDEQAMRERLQEIYAHLSATNLAFLKVRGIELVDPAGTHLLAEPHQMRISAGDSHLRQMEEAAISGRPVVMGHPSDAGSNVPFACLVIPLTSSATSSDGVPTMAIVAFERAENIRHFDWFLQEDGEEAPTSFGPEYLPLSSRYSAEIIDSTGNSVLEIGTSRSIGVQSTHSPLVRDLIERQRAGVLLHDVAKFGGGGGHLVAVVPLREVPYYLILEQDHDVALAIPNQLRQRLIQFGLLGFFSSLVAAWVTTRHVVRPTQQLVAAARRIAEGKLKEPIEVKAEDEIAELADALEAMRRRLSESREALALANQELEAKVQERTAWLQEVLNKVVSAQEEERRRLARELHDETAQTLSALSVSLDTIRNSLPLGMVHPLAKVAEARELADKLLEETRRLIFALRPAVLDDLGLIPALRWHAEEYLESKGVNVDLLHRSLPRRLPDYLEVVLFRIAQEAMNNVARHAHARNVRIELEAEQSLIRLTIRDDGAGFDVQQALARSGPEGGVGLVGMQERVSTLGGNLEIESEKGRGTTIRVVVPLLEGTE